MSKVIIDLLYRVTIWVELFDKAPRREGSAKYKVQYSSKMRSSMGCS